MPTLKKIKISELLQQVLDVINTLESRYYKDDMFEINTLLSVTTNHTQRIKTLNTFVEQKRKELMFIDGWSQYNPKSLSSTVLTDLTNSLKIEDNIFVISDEEFKLYTSEKSYPHTIASISVIFKILSNLDKLLINENTSVAQEPQGIYAVSTTTNHSTQLKWNLSDTAFIELFSSIYEMNAITHVSHDITRKELFQILSKTFNLNIKDAESKLSRAKSRKKNATPFLDSLRSAFINACSRKTSRE